MAVQNGGYVVLALRTVRVRPLSEPERPPHECREVLVGLAALRLSGESGSRRTIERWLLPLSAEERTASEILWNETDERHSLFGRTALSILSEGVSLEETVGDLLALTGEAKLIVQSKTLWMRILSTLPMREREKLSRIPVLSVGRLFKYLSGAGIDDRSTVERHRRNQDTLYRYARAISLESPYKMRDRRRTLLDEARFLGELWQAASERRRRHELAAGLKPRPEWLVVFRKVRSDDLDLSLQTHLELDVPFREKDLVKRRGAHWDSTRRCWFIHIWQDAVSFERWMTPEDFDDMMALTARMNAVRR